MSHIGAWSAVKAATDNVLPPEEGAGPDGKFRLLSQQEQDLIYSLADLGKAVDAGDVHAFIAALQLVYPTWRDQLDHSAPGTYSSSLRLADRFDLDNRNRGLVQFSRTLTDFLNLAEGQDDSTVDRWLQRVEDTIAIIGVYPSIYTGSSDIEDVKKAIARPNLYVFDAITGLERGFTFEEVCRTGVSLYGTQYLNYTPENLRLLRKSYTYKEIKSLLTVYSSVRYITKPSFDDFLATLDAGFTNGAEFKYFVKALRYDYTDPDLYRKAINAAQALSAEDIDVLKNKNSTAAEIAAVIVKL